MGIWWAAWSGDLLSVHIVSSGSQVSFVGLFTHIQVCFTGLFCIGAVWCADLLSGSGSHRPWWQKRPVKETCICVKRPTKETCESELTITLIADLLSGPVCVWECVRVCVCVCACVRVSVYVTKVSSSYLLLSDLLSSWSVYRSSADVIIEGI